MIYGKNEELDIEEFTVMSLYHNNKLSFNIIVIKKFVYSTIKDDFIICPCTNILEWV